MFLVRKISKMYENVAFGGNVLVRNKFLFNDFLTRQCIF